MATVEQRSQRNGGASILPPAASVTVDRTAAPGTRRRGMLCFVPPWMISMLLHILVLLILGLVTVRGQQRPIRVLTANSAREPAPEIDQFQIDVIDDAQFEPSEELLEPTVDLPEPLQSAEPIALSTPMESISVPIDVIDMLSEMAPAGTTLQSLGTASIAPLDSRSSEMKQELLRKYGGTEASEAAVTRALQWLKRHQLPNGSWTFAHQRVCRDPACSGPGDNSRSGAVNAATSLALLPFLGAGQTHMEGSHRDTVGRGLLFLIRNGRAGTKGGMPVLDLSESGGTMYSHGLAAIVLCEAYAMTHDPALAAPAQAALNYIAYSQSKRDGGWRYQPQQAGDTSVTGWQIMALKSGSMAHLVVPPATVRGAAMFLDKVQSPDGSMYGYTTPPRQANKHRPCHPIGLLSRMYLGWGRYHPSIQRGVQQLTRLGVQKNDIYYNYYAAQVLRHYGGTTWDQFNQQLRDWLVGQQVANGHAAGSWHWPDSVAHRGPLEGGRLCSTAFATMILEVYYRHMPLYADAAAEEPFPL